MEPKDPDASRPEPPAPEAEEESVPSATEAPAPPPPPPVGPPPEEPWATRYHYLLAEFDNFRRRTERERERTRAETRALVLRELLPLHDAFDRADEAFRTLPGDDPHRRGMELLRKEWERFLAGEQFRPVAEVGEPFRAEEEEAVGELPADCRHPDGSVAEVVQQGFRCPGGLLRPAKVLIARSSRAPLDAAAPASDGSVTE